MHETGQPLLRAHVVERGGRQPEHAPRNARAVEERGKTIGQRRWKRHAVGCMLPLNRQGVKPAPRLAGARSGQAPGDHDVDGTITPSTTVMASTDQVSCDLAGEAAILNLKNSVYYGLDTVGARIWTLVQEPITVGAVRDAMLREYDVEPERCERDLIDLLQKLAAEGLIAIKSAAA